MGNRWAAAMLCATLLLGGCASEPDVDALVAEGCGHVLAGEWERAKAPLRRAGEVSEPARRIYSWVAHSTPGAASYSGPADDSGAVEAFQEHAADRERGARDYGDAWRANAEQACRSW